MTKTQSDTDLFIKELQFQCEKPEIQVNIQLKNNIEKLHKFRKVGNIEKTNILIYESLALISSPYKIFPFLLKGLHIYIGFFYQTVNRYEEALKHFFEALKVNIETPEEITNEVNGAIANISKKLGMDNFHKKNFSAAEQFYMQSIKYMNELYQTSEYDPLVMVTCYSNLSVIYKLQHKKEAIKLCNLALEVKPNPGDNETLSLSNPIYLKTYIIINCNLGTISKITNGSASSLEYFQQAIDVIPEKDVLNYFALFLEVGNEYFFNEKYDQAINIYEQVFKHGDELKEKCSNLKKLYFYTYLNMARTYLHLEKYEDAIFHFKNFLQNCKTIDDNSAVQINKAIGDAYFSLKKYDLAKDHLKNALELILTKCNNKENEETRNEIFNKIILTDIQINDPAKFQIKVTDSTETNMLDLVSKINNLDLNPETLEIIGSNYTTDFNEKL